MPRLRRVNRLCSSMVSGTADRPGHGSTLCSPTVEKILCRSLISQRSHVGNLRQTIQGKGVIHKRVETVGVYPLVPPRRVGALPAEVQRKTLRPLGANTLTQFASPAQPVQRNRLPPGKGEHACAVHVPRSVGAEKQAAARIGRTACAVCAPRVKFTAE